MLRQKYFLYLEGTILFLFNLIHRPVVASIMQFLISYHMLSLETLVHIRVTDVFEIAYT